MNLKSFDHRALEIYLMKKPSLSGREEGFCNGERVTGFEPVNISLGS